MATPDMAPSSAVFATRVCTQQHCRGIPPSIVLSYGSIDFVVGTLQTFGALEILAGCNIGTTLLVSRPTATGRGSCVEAASACSPSSIAGGVAPTNASGDCAFVCFTVGGQHGNANGGVPDEVALHL